MIFFTLQLYLQRASAGLHAKRCLGAATGAWQAAEMNSPAAFPYRLDNRWKPVFVLLGVSDSDGVGLTEDGRFRATYGRFSLETPLENIRHTKVTGPHRWYTAVGIRLSFADDGLTLSTNHISGLCIEFVEQVPKVIGLKNHSSLWVSVADPEGLAAAIGR